MSAWERTCSHTWSRDEQPINVVLLDHSVEVDIGEHLSRVGTPMTQQPGLDVLEREGFLEQRVLSEVQHSHAEIERGSHVSVCFSKLIFGQGFVFDCRPCDPERGKRVVGHGGGWVREREREEERWGEMESRLMAFSFMIVDLSVYCPACQDTSRYVVPVLRK